MKKVTKKATPVKRAPRAERAAERVAPAHKAPLAHGVGHRKTAVARVWLRRGNGGIVINGQDVKDYFDTDINVLDAMTPIRVTSIGSHYNAEVNITGGGLTAQAGAVKLGIARALLQLDENIRPVLRQYGLLTVDSRQKERKKYGQKAARRRFQFVKR